MAGINLGDSAAIFFGVAEKDSVLVTASNGSQSLGDTDPGSVKVTRLSAYPKKGRGAMGVRAHRFLKGEDQLYFASLGLSGKLYDLDGNPITAPAIDDRRDGSGASLDSYLGSIS
jgi:DNA gyrase subunit A